MRDSILMNTKAKPTKPKFKRCKVCPKKFEVWSSTQQVCSPQCAIEFARVKAEKKEKQQDRERKANFKLHDLRTRRRAAKEACHKYIRMRDKDQPCICCGQPLKPDYHAGHFMESDNNPKIRYHEDNIHGQNLHCNYFKGGSGEYRDNLRMRIGLKRVESLEECEGGTFKRTGPELKEIEMYYKDKLKKLENEQ